MILCDIGNTSYHFKIHKSTFKISTKKSLSDQPSYSNEIIYFISVNKKATKEFIKKYPNAINLKDYVIFKTAYEGMGIDRQVVCHYIDDGIIVDLGSAITVDIMKKGKHKGGFIIPGIEAYKSIYPNISKKLSFDFEKNTNLDKIPLTTNDAINYAIFSAITLPIIKEYEKYKTKIYFTGGDKDLLKSYFVDIPVKYKKNMIFNSMKKIIEESKIKKGK
ncbi:type III pantothenate kinase [Arcobacteraceae bacterium]|nr:type III pantothenate kinase [Arcobacteraceae bacterium]